MYPSKVWAYFAPIVAALFLFVPVHSSAVDVDGDGLEEVFIFQDQMVKMLSPTGQLLERMPLPLGVEVAFGVSEVYPAMYLGQPAAAVLTLDLTDSKSKPGKLTFFSAGGFIGEVNVGNVAFSFVFVDDIDDSGSTDIVTVSQKTGSVSVITDPNTSSSQILSFQAPRGTNRQYSIVKTDAGPQLAAFLFGKSSDEKTKKKKKKKRKKGTKRFIRASDVRKLKTGKSNSVTLLNLLTGSQSEQKLATKLKGAVLPYYNDSVMAIDLKKNSSTLTTLDMGSGFSAKFSSEILATVTPGKFLDGSSQQALLVRDAIVEVYDLANRRPLASFDYTLVEGANGSGGLGGGTGGFGGGEGSSPSGFFPDPKMESILQEVETVIQFAFISPLALTALPEVIEKFAKRYVQLNEAQQDYYDEELNKILSLVGGSYDPPRSLSTQRVIAPNDFNFVLGAPVYVPQTVGRNPNLPFFCDFLYDGVGDFLWKPVSDNDGLPVTLGVGGTQIILRAKGSGKKIATGRNTGPSNGRVDTHRFTLSGAAINKKAKNKGFYIVVQEGFRTGGCIFIKDATERVER